MGPGSGSTGSGSPPDLLVVVLDAVRAKNVGPGGGVRPARTPVLEGLARRGTVFERAVAPSNWTVPSHLSMLTGLAPAVHGRRTFVPGASPAPTAASALATAGYATGIFTEQAHLVAGYGIEDGYAERFSARLGMANEARTPFYRSLGQRGWIYSSAARRLFERVPPTICALNAVNFPAEVGFKRERTGSGVVERFGRWLRDVPRGQPFHALVNFVEAHEPYPTSPSLRRAPAMARWYARSPRYFLLAVPGLRERVPWPALEEAYREAIGRLDQKVGQLLASIEETGRTDRTLVVVTSDHGQSFGEAGNVFHGCGATDSITRVPCIVAGPASLGLPGRVSRWTSMAELEGWLRAAAHGHPPFGPDGRAPAPFAPTPISTELVYCEGAPASDPNRSLRSVGTDQSWNHRLLAAYRGDDKWVLDTATGSVDHWAVAPDTDAGTPERLDAASARKARQELFGAYERLRPLGPAGPGMEAELDRRLRSWGYD